MVCKTSFITCTSLLLRSLQYCKLKMFKKANFSKCIISYQLESSTNTIFGTCKLYFILHYSLWNGLPKNPNVVIIKSLSHLWIIEVQCSTPASPMNGKILSNKKLFYYEDEISMECDHGFFIASSSRSRVLKCENSGQWSANMPNCTSMYCNLRIIKGALIYVSYSKLHKSPILQS